MSADDPIDLCLAGRISPEVALARLVLAGLSPAHIQARLGHVVPASSKHVTNAPPPLAATGAGVTDNARALAQLLAHHGGDLDRLARMLIDSGLDHTPPSNAPDAALARLRSGFDRAVACSPEAAVAAYSLGDPAILDAATAELIAWLAAETLTGPDRDVLDLGCGIGRVAAAVAERCRSVLGLDLSPGMIGEARRRHRAPNLRFEATSGSDLAALPDAAFDLVLAVDTFPYLMQAGAGLAERHIAEAARLLRQGGDLAILNLCYGRCLAVDRADARRWAGAHGFEVIRDGATPFRLWDATAFVLRRPA